MTAGFWTQSGAGLREKKPEKTEKLQGEEMEHKSPAAIARTEISRLDNTYGSVSFLTGHGDFSVLVERKSEYQEPVFDNTRETLTKTRLFAKKTEGASLYTDSHNKKNSAAAFTDKLDSPAERIFTRLKQSACEQGQNTVDEMISGPEQAERRIYLSLKSAVEEGRKMEITARQDDQAFLRRVCPQRLNGSGSGDTGSGDTSPGDISSQGTDPGSGVNQDGTADSGRDQQD